MTIEKLSFRAAAICALLLSAPLSAATFFTDAAVFQAAAPGAVTSDFSSVGEAGTFVDQIDFTVDDVNFRGFPQNFVIDGSIIPAYDGAFYYSSASPITEISSLRSFSALGFTYGSTEDSSALLSFTLSDGSMFSTTLPGIAGTTAFFGFTSDTPISVLTVSNAGSVFDVITFSAILATPIPEPDSWALFILGFGLIGGTMRRSRAIDEAQQSH